MLKQEHFYMEKIYQITTVVGAVEKDDIEQLYFVGYTKENENTPQKIIVETADIYDNTYYLIDNDYRLFDTKEQAQQFIGFYSNGKDFIKMKRSENETRIYKKI